MARAARPWRASWPADERRSDWSKVSAAEHDDTSESVRVLTTTLPDGYRLIVGDDDDRNDALQRTVLRKLRLGLRRSRAARNVGRLAAEP